MNIKDIERLMVKHGLVIRAIPLEHTFSVEVRNKNKYLSGVEYYDERFKRNMLRVTEKNKNGGKFIITTEQTQGTLIQYWGKPNRKFTGEPVEFYDSVEQAVLSFISSLAKCEAKPCIYFKGFEDCLCNNDPDNPGECVYEKGIEPHNPSARCKYYKSEERSAEI